MDDDPRPGNVPAGDWDLIDSLVTGEAITMDFVDSVISRDVVLFQGVDSFHLIVGLRQGYGLNCYGNGMRIAYCVIKPGSIRRVFPRVARLAATEGRA